MDRDRRSEQRGAGNCRSERWAGNRRSEDLKIWNSGAVQPGSWTGIVDLNTGGLDIVDLNGGLEIADLKI